MNFLRKFFVFIASSLLFLLLLLLVAFTSFRLLLGTPTQPENWLKQSRLYARFTESILEQAGKDNERGSDSLDPNQPEIRQAAKQAFSPTFLQQSSEQFINGMYGWLQGKTSKPEFRIDFGPAKANFAQGLAQNLKQRVANLPACASIADVPDSFDAASITCRPPGINANAEIDTQVGELVGSKDFLGETVITADSLTITKDGQKQPFYQQASRAPQAFKLALRMPWVISYVLLLAILTVLFASTNRRQGIKRVAYAFLSTGILLAIGNLIAWLALNRGGQLLADNTSSGFGGVGLAFARSVKQASMHITWIFAGAYLLIAVGIYIYLRTTRVSDLEQSATPNQPPLPSASI